MSGNALKDRIRNECYHKKLEVALVAVRAGNFSQLPSLDPVRNWTQTDPVLVPKFVGRV